MYAIRSYYASLRRRDGRLNVERRGVDIAVELELQGDPGLAEGFVGSSRMVVVLGDNLLEKSIRGAADAFRAQPAGARILLKEVSDLV